MYQLLGPLITSKEKVYTSCCHVLQLFSQWANSTGEKGPENFWEFFLLPLQHFESFEVVYIKLDINQDYNIIRLAVRIGLEEVRKNRKVETMRVVTDTGGENWGNQVIYF